MSVRPAEDRPHGSSFARARARAAGFVDVALRAFRAADATASPLAVAADRLAGERVASVGRLATIRLPRREVAAVLPVPRELGGGALDRAGPPVGRQQGETRAGRRSVS